MDGENVIPGQLVDLMNIERSYKSCEDLLSVRTLLYVVAMMFLNKDLNEGISPTDY